MDVWKTGSGSDSDGWSRTVRCGRCAGAGEVDRPRAGIGCGRWGESRDRMLDLGFRKFQGRLNPSGRQVSIWVRLERYGMQEIRFVRDKSRDTYKVWEAGIFLADRHVVSRLPSRS